MLRLRAWVRGRNSGGSERSMCGRIVLLVIDKAPVAVGPGSRGRIVVSGPQRLR